MITFSPFPRTRNGKNADEKQTEAMNRLVSILLHGIALHSFNFDNAQFAEFEKAVRKLRTEFEKAPDETTALLAAGAAIRILAEHSEAAERHAKTLRRETDTAITMLSDTLLDLAHAPTDVRIRLKNIGRDIVGAGAGAAGNAGPGEATSKLGACLAEIQAETAAAQGHPALPIRPVQETDDVTGLRAAHCAAEAIGASWRRRENYYVAVLALEQLEAINIRYGFPAGDQMLRLMSRHFDRQLPADTELFRWRGPCVAMLLRREVPDALVGSEVSRMAAPRLEAAISFREREVMAPISIAWKLFPLRAARSCDDMIRQMDDFACNRSRARNRVLAAAM